MRKVIRIKATAGEKALERELEKHGLSSDNVRVERIQSALRSEVWFMATRY